MALKKYIGNTAAVATDYNSNNNESLTMNGLNHIRTLIDRAGVYSKGVIDWWGDAYITSNGRNNGVASATAIYNTSTTKYSPGIDNEAAGDTTNNPAPTWSDPNNAFDTDDSTTASLLWNSDTNRSLGKTFASKAVKYVKWKVRSNLQSFGSTTVAWNLETYNGSTWTSVATVHTSPINADTTASGFYYLNTTTQGIRLTAVKSGTYGGGFYSYIYTLNYSSVMNATIITHTIPAGTFTTSITKAIGVPFIVDWEGGSGAAINYKLTNTGGDDTGWLSASVNPEVSSFTAFTHGEPDTLVVQLVPQTSSPTAGYPSVRGFAVRCSQ